MCYTLGQASEAKLLSTTYRGTLYVGVRAVSSIKDHKIDISVRHSHHNIGTTFQWALDFTTETEKNEQDKKLSWTGLVNFKVLIRKMNKLHYYILFKVISVAKLLRDLLPKLLNLFSKKRFKTFFYSKLYPKAC